MNDKPDPVWNCAVYNDKLRGSCSHVDGFLCDFPNCSILADYNSGEEGTTVAGGKESLKTLGNLIYEGHHKRFAI